MTSVHSSEAVFRMLVIALALEVIKYFLVGLSLKTGKLITQHLYTNLNGMEYV